MNMRWLVFSALLAVPVMAADPVKTTGPVEKVSGGFAFTEGPAADQSGAVFFTDIPNNKIHKVGPDGTVAVVTDQSNHSNGLFFDGKGNLIACEMDGQLARHTPAGERRVIAEGFEGTRFNAPNDLVIDKAGGVYFTDPHFRAPNPLPQKVHGVYYRAPNGTVSRLIDNLPAPNGIMLAPDQKTLYVFPTGQADMMAYPLESPGKVGEGHVFCRLKQKNNTGNSGADGVTIDEHGNLYITSGLGVQVWSPKGEHLLTVEFPEQPANCAFGGPEFNILYATCRTSLYRVPMSVKGLRPMVGEVQ